LSSGTQLCIVRSISSMRHLNAAMCIVAVVMVGTAVRAEDRAAIFNLNCAPCHSKDGKARTPAARKLGVKDLTQSKLGDEDIARQIREGRKGPDGKQQMPSFGDRLSPEQIRLLIQYVKEFRKD
jgi:mono/diheme cytochrome c family protein